MMYVWGPLLLIGVLIVAYLWVGILRIVLRQNNGEQPPADNDRGADN